MKKVGVLLLLFVGIGVLFFFQKKYNSNKQVLPASDSVIASPTSEILRSAQNDTNEKQRKILFVPYWGQTQERIPDEFGDTLIYFGITPGKDGIDKEEAGYLGLARFSAISEGRNTFLVLRMIDQEKNFTVLKDTGLQKRIIDDVITAAKQYGFEGIVLDLEISSLPFATITNQMNVFVEDFSKAAKKENLTFSMMFFGDTFPKLRSYDVVTLVKYIDQALIMAYDFHKAKGEPGPNFPYQGKEQYGYDFTVMVNDFLNIIPKEKLVIVFGMFGYDWTISEDRKLASAVTLTVAKKLFIDQCIFLKCVVKRDEKSGEITVTYIDNSGNQHVVWFEDEESVVKKQEFLKEKGVNTVGFWAYSYF